MPETMNSLPHRPLARIIRAEDAASWIDGYAFLERAKSEAEAIRAGARGEVAKARDEGRAEGRRAGEAEAAALLARAQTDMDRYLAEAEPRFIDLAMNIVRQVVGAFDDAELVARAARQAIAGFREEAGIVVHVAPDLVEEVERHLASPDFDGLAIRVVADRHLSGRRCMVTTPSTSIDVGIDAQLDAIRAAMLAASRSGA